MTWHGTLAFDRVWYTYIFGGAVLFKPDEFERVNGFSNLYYGWGAEDDDMSRRYKNTQLTRTINYFIYLLIK